MYLGIYVNTSSVDVTFLGLDAVNHDSSVNQRKGFSIPQNCYIDGDYVYLGAEVKALLAFKPDLSTAKNFFKNLSDCEEVVYEDSSGFQWSAYGLFCLFLKYIKEQSIQQIGDTIQGVIMTTSEELNTASQAIIAEAYKTVNLPLLAWIPFEDFFLAAYKNQMISPQLLFIQNSDSLAIRFFKANADNTAVDRIQNFVQGYGTEIFYDELSKILLDMYKRVAGSAMNITPAVRDYFLNISKKMIQEYTTHQRLFFKVFVGIKEPVIEFAMLRREIDKLLQSFIQAIASKLMEQISDEKEFSTVYLIGEDFLSILVQKHIATHPSLQSKKIITGQLVPEVIHQGMQQIFKDKLVLQQYQKGFEDRIAAKNPLSASAKEDGKRENTSLSSETLLHKIKNTRINHGVMKPL